MLFWYFFTLFSVYAALLAFVTWQAWRLRKILRSPSWAWRIAGFLIAFLGIVGLTLAQAFVTPPTALDSQPAPVAAYFTLAVLFWRIVSLACFAVEQSLLRRSLERLFQKPV